MNPANQRAFEADVLTAVMAHMNGHHANDCVLITRAFGELSDVQHAVLVEMTPAGARFTAATATGPHDVLVPWSKPIVIRPDLRDEMARMYRDACQLLGVTPRPTQE